MWTHSLDQIGDLKTALIQPPAAFVPTEMLVLCHGYGAPGDDLVGIAEPLIRQFQKHGRQPLLVFPEGPMDLKDYGMPGSRAWWPLNMARLMALANKNDFSEMRNEIPPGIDEARSMLVDTIGRLLHRFAIDSSQLTLGGFSQGAMLATDTALQGLDNVPKALVVFSGALICEQKWRSAASRLSQLQIIQSHGRYDTILPIQTGRWLNSLLNEYNQEVRYHEFDGPHTIPMEAIELISQ